MVDSRYSKPGHSSGIGPQSHDVPVLRAAMLTRALGLHFFAHLIGVSGERSAEGTATINLLSTGAWFETDPVTKTELFALCDIALGNAVRTSVPAGFRLATVSMDMHFSGIDGDRPVSASANVLWYSPNARIGAAECKVINVRGDVVATANASFVPLVPPAGVTPTEIAWMRDGRQAPSFDPEDFKQLELDDFELASASAASDAIERVRRSRRSVVDELMNVQWKATDVGRSRGMFAIGEVHGNRVRQLHGGIICGLLWSAIARSTERSMDLRSISVQFLSPGVIGSMLDVEAIVRRDGRNLARVDSELRSSSGCVAVGRATLAVAEPESRHEGSASRMEDSDATRE